MSDSPVVPPLDFPDGPDGVLERIAFLSGGTVPQDLLAAQQAYRAGPTEACPLSVGGRLADFSLRQFAELHAHSHQILEQGAEGSQQQAQCFQHWLEQHTLADAPDIPVASGLRLGTLRWLELSESEYRFVVLTPSSSYLIPRRAGGVPPVDGEPPLLGWEET